MKISIAVFTGILLAAFCVVNGCQSKSSNKPGSISPEIAIDAQGTYLEFQNAVHDGKESQGSEIPSKYWKKGIQELEPVRVYMHRANMVVVQRIKGNVEEGQYICIPSSSYVPQPGDDGFEFDAYPERGSPDDPWNSVFHYKRKIRKQ